MGSGEQAGGYELAGGVVVGGEGRGAVEVAGEEVGGDLVGFLVPGLAVAEEDGDGDFGAFGRGKADEPGVREERLGAVERAGLARDLDGEQRVALAIVEA